MNSVLTQQISIDEINREGKKRKFSCKFFLNGAIVNPHDWHFI